jgi:outer membrane protein assembly factor BamE (lipoprotein component of BamABCDE complex)
MLRNIIVLLFAMTVVACASAGRSIDRSHLGDIKDGVQNKEQIRSWFGQPYTMKTGLTGHPKRCVERWTYEFAKARGFGTVTYSEILVVDFDTKGKVCDHAFSQTGSN